jgi:PDDEXK-like domain of unknown function (DUF3799)
MIELNGFFEGMPYEEYAKIDALNGSSIVHMRRSPMKYRHMKDNPQPETPALKLGTIAHRMIFEPALMGEIAVWGLKEDEKVRRGKVWDAFQDEHYGKTILTEDEYANTAGIACTARLSPLISKYADAEGPTEVSIFWRHPYTGRRMKARLDKWIPSTHTVMDLKSCRDCTSYRFGAQAFQLGYHIKMGLQWAGVRELTGKDPDMRLCAIESRAPYESAAYRVTKDVLLQGVEELDNLVAKLDECEKLGRWPAEQECETDLLLPAWATAQEEEYVE